MFTFVRPPQPKMEKAKSPNAIARYNFLTNVKIKLPKKTTVFPHKEDSFRKTMQENSII